MPGQIERGVTIQCTPGRNSWQKYMPPSPLVAKNQVGFCLRSDFCFSFDLPYQNVGRVRSSPLHPHEASGAIRYYEHIEYSGRWFKDWSAFRRLAGGHMGLLAIG
jgi:hypothetical protein